MELITRQTQANDARARWYLQYKDSIDAFQIPGIAGKHDPKTVYNQLVALGNNPDPDRVDEIIGSVDWTQPPWCTECGQGERSVVAVHLEYNAVYLCLECLEKAREALKTGNPIRQSV